MDHNQYPALAAARHRDLLTEAGLRRLASSARAEARAVRLARRADQLKDRAVRLRVLHPGRA